MIHPDVNGKLWNRGTRIGLVYSTVAFVLFGLTTTQDPDGPLAWLEKFAPLVILAPLAAGSHAYKAGQIDMKTRGE